MNNPTKNIHTRTQLLKQSQVLDAITADETEDKKFNLQDFLNSFNTLDPQNIGSWPVPVKATMILATMILAFLVGYFLLVGPRVGEIGTLKDQTNIQLEE